MQLDTRTHKISILLCMKFQAHTFYGCKISVFHFERIQSLALDTFSSNANNNLWFIHVHFLVTNAHCWCLPYCCCCCFSIFTSSCFRSAIPILFREIIGQIVCECECECICVRVCCENQENKHISHSHKFICKRMIWMAWITMK